MWAKAHCEGFQSKTDRWRKLLLKWRRLCWIVPLRTVARALDIWLLSCLNRNNMFPEQLSLLLDILSPYAQDARGRIVYTCVKKGGEHSLSPPPMAIQLKKSFVVGSCKIYDRDQTLWIYTIIFIRRFIAVQPLFTTFLLMYSSFPAVFCFGCCH